MFFGLIMAGTSDGAASGIHEQEEGRCDEAHSSHIKRVGLPHPAWHNPRPGVPHPARHGMTPEQPGILLHPARRPAVSPSGKEGHGAGETEEPLYGDAAPICSQPAEEGPVRAHIAVVCSTPPSYRQEGHWSRCHTNPVAAGVGRVVGGANPHSILAQNCPKSHRPGFGGVVIPKSHHPSLNSTGLGIQDESGGRDRQIFKNNVCNQRVPLSRIGSHGVPAPYAVCSHGVRGCVGEVQDGGPEGSHGALGKCDNSNECIHNGNDAVVRGVYKANSCIIANPSGLPTQGMTSSVVLYQFSECPASTVETAKHGDCQNLDVRVSRDGSTIVASQLVDANFSSPLTSWASVWTPTFLRL